MAVDIELDDLDLNEEDIGEETEETGDWGVAEDGEQSDFSLDSDWDEEADEPEETADSEPTETSAITYTDINGTDLDIDQDDETEPDEDGQYTDTDGTIVSNDDLMSDENNITNKDQSNNFISDTGEIVVMDNTDTKTGFELSYIDIEKIAIIRRIRVNNNVDDLVQSIRSTGLLMPVVVAPTSTDGIYVLLDGYRRVMSCARLGKRSIPCIINTKVSIPEIPIIEAMYNHNKKYSVQEQIKYIDYLEKEKGIMSASMIEYLLQMAPGEYTKLKDIMNDNDEDIVQKLLDGIYTIDAAFRKLEQRRKKETTDEKENHKAEAVYGNEEKSGADELTGSGEEIDNEATALTDDEIKELTINAKDIDDGLEEQSVEEMNEDANKIDGSFAPHHQKAGEREYIDPAIKKAVQSRDNFTCACCKISGQALVDTLDLHHILPVFLNGADSVDNSVLLCLTCHRLVHLYSTGDLHLPSAKTETELAELTDEEKVLYNTERMRYKRVIKLGAVIREGMAKKGLKREQYKKEHPTGNIGRNKPGEGQEQA